MEIKRIKKYNLSFTGGFFSSPFFRSPAFGDDSSSEESVASPEYSEFPSQGATGSFSALGSMLDGEFPFLTSYRVMLKIINIIYRNAWSF